MWTALKTVFERKGVASQLYLRKKLLLMKYLKSDSLEKHFLKFEEVVRELKSVGATLEDIDIVCHLLLTVVRELKSVGATLEDIDIVCHLLLTLPKNFDPIVTALETMDADKLKLEFVKGKLLDYEMKRRHEVTEACDTTASPAAFSSNFKPRYHNRKVPLKPGRASHLKNKCWFRKQAQEVEKEVLHKKTEEHIAFVATALQTASTNTVKWYVDSGATDHMVNSEYCFSSVKNLNNPVNISVAKNDESLRATKIGTISIILNENKYSKKAEIKDVLYVENLRHNLLSVQKLEKSGFKVIFEKGCVYIKNNLTLLAVGYMFQTFGATVCWNTRKQNSVALSSTEAEYIALSEAAKEGIWLNNLLKEFGFTKLNVAIFEDNQSCIKLTQKWEHKRTKHIDIRYNFIQDVVKKNIISISYISTNDQTADVLTKNLGCELFNKHRYNLGLRELKE
ncbi:hypothetical protein QE152_g11174 [Popillia japonica]|uniref:Retrovirus-related Pol polyprotein from transposon TNT 1-94-like beta-barrel domain-containing protein n=1 Tax=Popillia japonica TaxID=7064 RepID=A0AAW1LM83_POPJA